MLFRNYPYATEFSAAFDSIPEFNSDATTRSFLLHSVDSARLLRTLQQRPTEFSAALDSTSNFCCFAKVFVQPEAFFAALTRLVGSLGLEFVWLRTAKPLTVTRVYPLRLGRVQSACVGRARRRLFFAGKEGIKPLAIAGSLLSPNW